MHIWITVLIAMLMGGMSDESFAQQAEVNPRTLTAQIGEQEAIVKTSRGKRDGDAWLKLAVLLQDAEQFRQSEQAYRRTIGLMRHRDRATIADVLDHMGTMYVQSGQLAKAELLEREALAKREEVHDLLGAGVSHTHLAMLQLGEHALGEAQTEAALAVSLLVTDEQPSSAKRASPEQQMTALIDLAQVRCAMDQCAAAIPELQRAREIARANYPDDSLPSGYLDFLLGHARWKSGNTQAAGEMMQQGVRELATVIGWGHPVYLRTLSQYKLFLVETGQVAEAAKVEAQISGLERTQRMAVGPGDHPVGSESLR